MKEIKRKTIKLYQKDNGECPVIQWLESLNDSIRYRIKSRFAWVSLGNLGEFKMLGDSLGELKFKLVLDIEFILVNLMGKLFFYYVVVIKLVKRKILN